MQKKEVMRHGDLAITKINKIPTGFILTKNNILAYGEVTGHKHAIIADRQKENLFNIYEDGNGNHVIEVIKGRVNLVHEEHETITLEPGIYWQTVQVEYDPIENMRKVID